jgi:glycosyltransferase involved in cell wall biosynthesis
MLAQLRANDRQVHVLHVVRTLIPEGGMERAMRRVVGGTAARGIRHSILLLSDAKNTLDFGTDAEISRVVSPPRDPRMPLGIYNEIDRLNPSVIHVRNFGPWPDTTLARMFHRPLTPLVWSFHGVDALVKIPPSKKIAFRTASAMTQRIFAVSIAAKDLLKDLIGLPDDRIEVILNGVDTEEYAPAPEPKAPSKHLVVGTVGRLEPIKNHAMLLDAAGELHRDGLDIEVRFGGTGSMEPMLRQKAAELGISEHVKFCGYVSDVPRFLHQLDVFTLTSDSEGNPNALLEAMSTGLPCVSTSVGAVTELLQRGRSGVLVAPRDSAALAKALADFATSPELRTLLSHHARERIIREYSLARMLDAYEDLYRRPERRSALRRWAGSAP